MTQGNDFRQLTFIGMRRCGNHGVTHWLIRSLDNVLYYNNLVKNELIINTDKFLQKQAELHIKNVIVSVEVEDLFPALNNPNFNSVFTKILLIRDPFNLYASKRRLYEKRYAEIIKNDKVENRWIFEWDKDLKRWRFSGNGVYAFIRNWKQYAREYLGLTKYLGDNIINISYNKWVVDGEYRKKLLIELNADRLDTPHDEMMHKNTLEFKKLGHKTLGLLPGSSFDQFNYMNDSTKMDVLNRWRTYEHTWGFEQLTGDSELMELSERIFGKIVH